MEEILDHQFEDGVLLYKIKWEGYDKKSDQTWESDDKLEGATEALKEYHEKIGGKPIQRKVITPSSSSHKRPRTDSKPSTPTTATKNSKVRRLNESARPDSPATDNLSRWVPPKGSWEEDVMQVDTIERDDQGLHIYLDWNNGKKTRHAIEKIYNKCPKKMLRFYEQHLYVHPVRLPVTKSIIANPHARSVFKEGDASVSGAVSGNGILSNGR